MQLAAGSTMHHKTAYTSDLPIGQASPWAEVDPPLAKGGTPSAVPGKAEGPSGYWNHGSGKKPRALRYRDARGGTAEGT